jgi:hypothetical protein
MANYYPHTGTAVILHPVASVQTTALKYYSYEKEYPVSYNNGYYNPGKRSPIHTTWR